MVTAACKNHLAQGQPPLGFSVKHRVCMNHRVCNQQTLVEIKQVADVNLVAVVKGHLLICRWHRGSFCEGLRRHQNSGDECSAR
ncbi:MAG: hypothetical protein AAFX95_03440 [Cyanobacteria bacterium J06639_16]